MKQRWHEMVYVLFVLAGAAVVLLRPFSPALDSLGHYALAGMILTTGLWVLEPFHISVGVGSCLLFASMLAVGVPARVVFSGFTQSAVWTMIPALFFGYALKKTGLGKRIAFRLLRCLPKVTYLSLIVAWVLIGIILSILTPSITVRIVIAMPLAKNCVDLCGFEKDSKERSFLLLTAWAMMVIPGIGWSTGSLLGPVLTGIFGSVEGIPEVSFTDWFRSAFLPTCIVTVLILVLSRALLKPSGKIMINKEVFTEAYRSLQPMQKEEKLTLWILLICFAFLATGMLHGIPDAALCLFALLLLFALGVLDRQDIGKGISWDIVLFVGASMSIGEIFSYTGVSGWLSGWFQTIFALIPSAELLLLLLLVFLFAFRFVDVALLTPTIVILAPSIPALWQTHGIHPYVWIPVFSFAICAFFARYQNMFLLIGETTLGKEGWTVQYRIRYALIYFAACVIAVAVSIPYWRAIGWIA